MPYRAEWFDPELFLEHRGVRIYHSYDDDGENVLTYWYTTSDDEDAFDARALPTFADALDSHDDVHVCRTAIIAAIESGYLTQDGITEKG